MLQVSQCEDSSTLGVALKVIHDTVVIPTPILLYTIVVLLIVKGPVNVTGAIYRLLVK